MEKINLIAADIGAGSGRICISGFDGKKIFQKRSTDLKMVQSFSGIHFTGIF